MSTPADDLQIDRHAAIQRTELAPGSWVEIIPGFVREASAVLTELHDTLPWQQTEVLRYDRYVPERRLGVGVRHDSHPMLHQTGLHLRSRFRVPFTGVAAILYRNGDDFQGLHSDREMRWLDDTVIAIAVLGTRRPFVLRPGGGRGAGRACARRLRARRRDSDAGGGRPADHGRGVPTRVAARRAQGVDRPTTRLTHMAMDEPARTTGHQPHLLRRPPLQRWPTPARLPQQTRLSARSGRDVSSGSTGTAVRLCVGLGAM